MQSAEIRVFSSAAPRGVFRDLVPEFERTTGHRLLINYQFATDLKRRIEAGDPFDVAILPPDLADNLVQRGKLAAASRIDLGRTGMGVAVRKGAPKPDIPAIRPEELPRTAPLALAELRTAPPKHGSSFVVIG